jgi:hypothetical protein
MFDTVQVQFVSIFALVALITGTVTTAIIGGVANTIYFFVWFLVMILVSFVDIRCTLLGGCDFYGWLKTVLLAVMFMFNIIIFSYALRLRRKEIKLQKEAEAAAAQTASELPIGEPVEPTELAEPAEPVADTASEEPVETPKMDEEKEEEEEDEDFGDYAAF